MLKAFSLVMGFWMALLASSTGEKPTYSISLSPALLCKSPEHIAVRMRFAPTGDSLAIVLQDYSFRSGRAMLPVWHVVVASRDGTLVRQLVYEKPQRPDYFTALSWSPAGDYIALETAKAVTLIRVGDGKSCRFARERAGETAASIGFIEGPRFVVNRPGKSNPALEVYETDCAMSETSPSPSSRPGVALTRGDALAFQSGFGILLTDARGRNVRFVEFNSDRPLPISDRRQPAGDSPRPALRRRRDDPSSGILRRGLAENGSVLCSGFPAKVQCFSIDSGEEIGSPPLENLGPPLDTSAAASRGVWPIFEGTTLDVVLFWAALAGGQAYDPSPEFRPPGFLVWDYRTGAEILRLPAKSQRTALYGIPFVRAVALAPKGDCLAVAAKDSVLIFELSTK